MDKTDILIIGAGAVGLAVAAELSGRMQKCSIVLMERHSGFGQETSSRNSEVIHAGIYYPAGSLKARLCVEGNRRLYDFCERHGVPHARTGKLIVAATPEEAATLEGLMERGHQNGVEDLQLIDAAAAARYEPHIHAVAAIFSPSTGIIDSHRLMARLEALAAGNRVSLAYRHTATDFSQDGMTKTVSYSDAAEQPNRIACRWLINCAGLGSADAAARMGIDIDVAGYRMHLCKGEYFSIPPSKARKVSRLIYPPPYQDLRGLGIHVTRTLDGAVKLGPNAFYVDSEDYTVDTAHAAEFYDSVRPYLPFLEPSDLQPDTAGIRPKLQAPGTPIRDFVIRHEADRGMEGVINLIGIESPGLTSCLSIADMVAGMIETHERTAT